MPCYMRVLVCIFGRLEFLEIILLLAQYKKGFFALITIKA
jgi:hypothetical protein